MRNSEDFDVDSMIREAQPLPAKEEDLVFEVLSPARRTDFMVAAALAVGLLLAGFAVMLFTDSMELLVFAVYPALIGAGLAFFLFARSRMKLVIRKGVLEYHTWRKVSRFKLEECVVSLPHAHSYGGNDYEHVLFEPELLTGSRVRVYLPDSAVKGDLVRERFLASLQGLGADVRIPGFMPPRGGIKYVEEVLVERSFSGLALPGWAGMLTALAGFALIPTLLVAGVQAALAAFVGVVILSIAAWFFSRRHVQVRDRTIIFTSEKLTSRRGQEVEWEVPMEMLQGLIVESRHRPFRGCEVRVVAKTPYHRSLPLIAWSSVKSSARYLLLAHARARGIAVEFKRGGEEPGSALVS